MGKKIETTKKVLEKSSNIAKTVAKVATVVVTVTDAIGGLMSNKK